MQSGFSAFEYQFSALVHVCDDVAEENRRKSGFLQRLHVGGEFVGANADFVRFSKTLGHRDAAIKKSPDCSDCILVNPFSTYAIEGSPNVAERTGV